MKKVLIMLIIIVGVFTLTVCNNNLKTIKYSDFKEKINNKETFMLIVSQTGCSHCEEYEPILKKVLNDNNIDAYSLNITYMSKSDFKEFKDKYSFEGTPTTMFFNKGEEIFSSRIIRSTTEKKLTNTLKRLKYIK